MNTLINEKTAFCNVLEKFIVFIDSQWEKLLLVNSINWFNQEWDVPTDVYPYFEISCIAEGDCALSMNGREYQATKGQVFFTDISIPTRCTGSNFKIHYITLGTDDAQVYSQLKQYFRDLSYCLQPKFPLTLEDSFLRFHSEASFSRHFNRLDLKCLLLSILIRLYRGVNGTGTHEDFKTISPRNELMVTDLINYLNINFNQEIRLKYLSKRFGNCCRTLNLIFRSATGKTILQYLIHLRIERAQWLLRFTSLDITEIALETGFCDCQHFSRVFKKTIGIPPRQYRICELQGQTLLPF